MTKFTTGAPLYIFRSIYCPPRWSGMQIPCITPAPGEEVMERHTIEKSRGTKTNADDSLSCRRVSAATVYCMSPNRTGVGPRRSWSAGCAPRHQNALIAAPGDQLRAALRLSQEVGHG
jgi:hypothetical protein